METIIIGQGYNLKENSSVGEELIKQFQSHRYNSFTCLVAFASFGGVSSLRGEILEAKAKGVNLKVILGILEAIELHVSKSERDFYLAALLSTASDIVDTVGKHFAQPIKARDSKGNIKMTVYNKAVKDKTIDFVQLYHDWLLRYHALPKSNRKFSIFHGDFLDCLRHLPDSVTTVYADPPYTRDHYSRFYHVLETIALRDTPQLSTTNIRGNQHISNGIYRKDRHQSPFCIKSKAPEAFQAMFEIISKGGRTLLLSYSPYDETKKSHPRVVTMQQLIEWARKYFKYVDMVSAGSFKHNKLNSTEHFLDASDEAEILIICSNNKAAN